MQTADRIALHAGDAILGASGSCDPGMASTSFQHVRTLSNVVPARVAGIRVFASRSGATHGKRRFSVGGYSGLIALKFN